MCGILGILGPEPAAADILDGLLALQHRGQDAAGVATFDDRVHLHKGFGLVREAFGPDEPSRLHGRFGIGHVRYPTIGLGSVADAQPLFVNAPYGIAMAHNGNVTNFSELRDVLQTEEHRQINTDCDVEVILNVFAEGLSRHTDLPFPEACFEAGRTVYERVRGSYSAVAAVAGRGLVVLRDPFGIKPCVYGTRRNGKGTAHIVASESCALDALGGKYERDVRPGEVMVVDLEGDLHTRQVVESSHYPCIFEYIYFARPDSMLDDISVYKTRLRLGQHVARRVKERGLQPDVVVPVPDSSRPAAQAVAEALGVKLREGLLKNRYIGRTFIMPHSSDRSRTVRYKLSPMRLEIEGKNVLLVDDSIVRGTTMRQLIGMVREAGALQVYVVSTCPPIRHPCVYGIDMSVKGEFIASGRTEQEIERSLGADALIYNDIPDMIDAAQRGNPAIEHFCKACMDGAYPTGDVTDETLAEIESERLKARKE